MLGQRTEPGHDLLGRDLAQNRSHRFDIDGHPGTEGLRRRVLDVAYFRSTTLAPVLANDAHDVTLAHDHDLIVVDLDLGP